MLVTVGNQLDRSVEESLWRTGQRINKVITSEHWDSEKDVKCKRVHSSLINKGFVLFFFLKGNKLSI